MRQNGTDGENQTFKAVLSHLRNGIYMLEDHEFLRKRFIGGLSEEEQLEISSLTHIIPTREQCHVQNLTRLRMNVRQMHVFEAQNEGNRASPASSEDACSLEKTVSLAVNAKVRLNYNLVTHFGLVKYVRLAGNGEKPVVFVEKDKYTDPAFLQEYPKVIPVTQITRSWDLVVSNCSRTQLSLELSRAVTVHKSQGLTLDKVCVDLGSKGYQAGLSYVALSRVKRVENLYIKPFVYTRIQTIGKLKRLTENFI